MTRELVPDQVTAVDTWWQGLRAAALLGTARRPVPPLPALGVAERPGAGAEERLLDAAALGDAARRAGAAPGVAPEPAEPAATESLPVAPTQAAQILELLLTQAPVARAAGDRLVRHWLTTAARAGRIAPPGLLPALLRLGTAGGRPMRRDLAPVIGARGAWLAGHNPDWAWASRVDRAAEPGDRTSRTEQVAAARAADPVTGRSLVLETWDTDAARARVDALAGLAVGLAEGDEPFLERCLDDGARSVRDLAADLLARLPESARAARMEARLRPLVSVRGTLRRTVDVALPDDPDRAAVRDGLVDPGRGVSRRAHWLRKIVAGAPLTLWTELVDGDPERVVGMLRGENADDVLAGLRDAAAARRDPVWARALLSTAWESRLVALLPARDRESLLVARVGGSSLATMAPELSQVPTPWGPDLSAAVLGAIGRQKDAGHAVRLLRDTLVVALDPSTAGAVERLMGRVGDDTVLRTCLRDVLQYQSLHRSISEAFR